MYQKTKIYPPTKLKPFWLIKYHDGTIETYHHYSELPEKIKKKVKEKAK